MSMSGLPALRLNAWLLWGFALLLMVYDGVDWWLGERDLPQLLTVLALLACGNAVEHARRLFEQHARQLAALRERPPGSQP